MMINCVEKAWPQMNNIYKELLQLTSNGVLRNLLQTEPAGWFLATEAEVSAV